MKTAFFPFTCLSHPVVIALKRLFGPFTVYQPLSDTVPAAMIKWQHDHQLHLCFPAAGNESEIHQMLSEYRRWVESRPLTQREFLKFQNAHASLSNDDQSFRIRDEIRRRIRGKGSDPAVDPLISARLFLALAQAYDSRRLEITDDLTRLEKTEENLFNILRGDIGPGAPKEEMMPVEAGETGSFMIDQRLSAWSRLMLEDDPLPVIYATTSREAFETITQDTPRVDLLPGFDAAPFPLPSMEASRQLMAYLEAVAASTRSSDYPEPFKISANQSGRWMRLTLGIVPETSAHKVFSRYAGDDGLIAEKGKAHPHTLLALVEGQILAGSDIRNRIDPARGSPKI